MTAQNPKILSLFLLIILITSSSYIQTRRSDNDKPFRLGEKFQYKINYGFLNIARATITIDDTMHHYAGKENLLKVDVKGKTTGMAGWITNVDDRWCTYVDPETLLPHVAIRDINEGNYKKDEIAYFDHSQNRVELVIDKNNTTRKKGYKIVNQSLDLLSGYLFIRQLDYSKYKEGEVIVIKAFFEGELYDFELIYAGKERIKTKLGKRDAIKIIPNMPKNKIFSGKNPIQIWISDDENRVPLKVDADMFLGHVRCHLVSMD